MGKVSPFEASAVRAAMNMHRYTWRNGTKEVLQDM
jgi:hypothetical protein